MMHDFALSAEHIVLMDLPIVFRLDIARNSPRDLPYRWSDDYGARLGVLRRDDPYGPILASNRTVVLRYRSHLESALPDFPLTIFAATPHTAWSPDMRARCHAAGGELEQIQFLLGHVSIQTTERYLGCKQRIRGAVNDEIGIEPPD